MPRWSTSYCSLTRRAQARIETYPPVRGSFPQRRTRALTDVTPAQPTGTTAGDRARGSGASCRHATLCPPDRGPELVVHRFDLRLAHGRSRRGGAPSVVARAPGRVDRRGAAPGSGVHPLSRLHARCDPPRLPPRPRDLLHLRRAQPHAAAIVARQSQLPPLQRRHDLRLQRRIVPADDCADVAKRIRTPAIQLSSKPPSRDDRLRLRNHLPLYRLFAPSAPATGALLGLGTLTPCARHGNDRALGAPGIRRRLLYEVVEYPDEVPHRYSRTVYDMGRIPDGRKVGNFHVPTNLAGYRHVYRAHIDDPDIQDARAHGSRSSASATTTNSRGRAGRASSNTAARSSPRSRCASPPIRRGGNIFRRASARPRAPGSTSSTRRR